MGMGVVMAITPAAFNRVLAGPAQGKYEYWKDSLARSSFSARPIPASLTISVKAVVRRESASNVVGIRLGTDPNLRNEWIVISAHYDHLGFKSVSEGEDGVWNGADDNGSGTSSVLELARLFSEAPALKRSMLILFTAGEDRGMLGSAYYVKHPVIPLDQVVADINIDMVGRSDGTLTAYTEGGPELFQLASAAGDRYGLRVTADQNPSWRVLYFLDSYHFARFGVPFIELFTQMHTDYHQPSDEISLIHFEELTRITDIAFDIVRRLGDSSIRPTFKAPAWFVTPNPD
jgi:Zn-dependent M28 family amino/carboxypeptidase